MYDHVLSLPIVYYVYHVVTVFKMFHMSRIGLYRVSFAGSQQLLQRCGSVLQPAHLGLACDWTYFVSEMQL